jgi:hypothetical protein
MVSQAILRNADCLTLEVMLALKKAIQTLSCHRNQHWQANQRASRAAHSGAHRQMLGTQLVAYREASHLSPPAEMKVAEVA